VYRGASSRERLVSNKFFSGFDRPVCMSRATVVHVVLLSTKQLYNVLEVFQKESNLLALQARTGRANLGQKQSELSDCLL